MSSRDSRRRRHPLVRHRGRRARRHHPQLASRARARSRQTSERCSVLLPRFHVRHHRRELPASDLRRVPRAHRRLYPDVRTCHPWSRRPLEHPRAPHLRLLRPVRAYRFPGMRTTRRLTFSKKRGTSQRRAAAPRPLPAGAFRTTPLSSDCPIHWQRAFRHRRAVRRSRCDRHPHLRHRPQCSRDLQAIPPRVPRVMVGCRRLQ